MPYKNKSDEARWKREKHLAVRNFRNSLKAKPCTDCGIQYPWYVMEFDHLPRFNKKFNLAHHGSRGYAAVLAEAEKCEVVCANCHATRTYARLVGKIHTASKYGSIVPG